MESNTIFWRLRHCTHTRCSTYVCKHKHFISFGGVSSSSSSFIHLLPSFYSQFPRKNQYIHYLELSFIAHFSKEHKYFSKHQCLHSNPWIDNVRSWGQDRRDASWYPKFIPTGKHQFYPSTSSMKRMILVLKTGRGVYTINCTSKLIKVK